MAENKIKRYSWIHELELDLDVWNNKGYFVQSMSDSWSRILVIYEKDLNYNINEDGKTNWDNKGEDTKDETWWMVLSSWGDTDSNDDDMVD